jgi:tRNA U34 5-methylaminomethyl-2-thiouridine-forming methyltransferase MnmC
MRIIYLLAAILLCVRAAQPIQSSDTAISEYLDESEFEEENILAEIFKVIYKSIKFLNNVT